MDIIIYYELLFNLMKNVIINKFNVNRKFFFSFKVRIKFIKFKENNIIVHVNNEKI